MPKGKYPYEYFKNPNIDKPIEEIYADIDAYSGEFFEEDHGFHNWLEFCIVLPPLNYEGKMIKGLFFNQGMDFTYKMYPELSEIFHSMCHTMWSSYPWSKMSDAYLTCYKNPHREEWFKKTNPDRADKILIPLQDADFTNEYHLAPAWNCPKDIDVLTISRLSDLKNVPLVAKAFKIYREKYGQNIKLTCIVGKDFDLNYKGLDDREIHEMRMVEKELVHTNEYINFIPSAPYNEIPKYYTRAKLYLLGSIFEGKNRTIQEAMSCNTPVIAFKDFNKYSRSDHWIFPEGAGMLIPEFSAESMADTIHNALNNLGAFKPRKLYLQHYGRKNFANKCIDSFPYYAENIPDYVPGKIHENIWVDLAVQDNYQISYHDFLYSKNTSIQHTQGLDKMKEMLKFFYSRFRLKWDRD